MAEVNPAPRRRIRPVPPGPTPHVQPTVDRHDLYEPFDGEPLPEPTRDPVTNQLVQAQRSITERVTTMSRADREEAKLLVLQTLHQFVIAKTPSDVICQRMGMSFRDLRVWRKRLTDKLREDAKFRDPHDYIGPMLAELEEAKAQAWREVASAPSKEWARRMRAIDVVMKANNEIARLLQVAGLFDNQPMRPLLTTSEETDGGASTLKTMAENFLSGGYAANQRFRKSPTPADTIVEGS
jgi:hypothetical protein